jgi:microcystin degradation protein MlrC
MWLPSGRRIKPVRVGIISLAHESNTFAKTPTTLADFEQLLLLTGPAFGTGFPWKHHEVSGFLDTLREVGIEAVPIFMATAPPSGTIEKAALRELLDRLFAEVEKAGKVDGYLVAPHGAAVSDEIADVDGHWLTELRKRAGVETPIISTLDPHANLTPAMVSACNALVAYSTNPHIDQYQAGVKAAELMDKTLRGVVRPVTAAAYPPIAINIERQFTDAEPCRSLYAYGRKISQEPGVLSTSVILGFPYADVPEMGSALMVVMDNDRQRAQQLADEWAAELYRRRTEFVGELIEIDQAIEKALAAPSPVCLLDMGDNVGGGSPADATIIVEALDRQKVGNSFVCIYDPAAVERARAAGTGSIVTLSMGGKTDQSHGNPFTAEVSVISLHEGRFTEPKARHGAKSDFDMGSTALVSTASRITIMLTSKRTFPVSMVQLTSCGLDPGSFRILVAKGVHAPVAGYAEVCKTFIRVNTPGVTTADMGKFIYHRRRQPLFPFENV